MKKYLSTDVSYYYHSLQRSSHYSRIIIKEKSSVKKKYVRMELVKIFYEKFA
jgi:hypothetical protein